MPDPLLTPPKPADAEGFTVPIAVVERDTGIAKDTLRIWERRYGFPSPQRDANGERNYSAEDVEKLRTLKRLMDQGLRPGKLIGLPLRELQGIAQTRPGRARSSDEQAAADRVTQLVMGLASGELRAYLQRQLVRQGLRGFLSQTLARLNQDVGEAWARGAISVAHERLYTQAVQIVLHSLIAAQPLSRGHPRILLATVPGELHALGLLMVEALWSAEGAECISLGTQFPVADIPAVAAQGQIDVVALSFSQAFNSLQAMAALRTLRASLPSHIDLWAGGAALGGRRRLEGVRILGPIEAAADALAEWRAARPSPADPPAADRAIAG